MEISRRPATPADESIARELHERGYRDVVVRQFGSWNQEQQQHFFAEKWFPGEYEILLYDQAECGYVWVTDEEDSVTIREIVVLPEYQNRGIGTRVLKEEIARAHTRNVPVKLRVLAKSRALSLYTRLGFRKCGRTATHILMKQ